MMNYCYIYCCKSSNSEQGLYSQETGSSGSGSGSSTWTQKQCDSGLKLLSESQKQTVIFIQAGETNRCEYKSINNNNINNMSAYTSGVSVECQQYKQCKGINTDSCNRLLYVHEVGGLDWMTPPPQDKLHTFLTLWAGAVVSWLFFWLFVCWLFLRQMCSLQHKLSDKPQTAQKAFSDELNLNKVNVGVKRHPVLRQLEKILGSLY